VVCCDTVVMLILHLVTPLCSEDATLFDWAHECPLLQDLRHFGIAQRDKGEKHMSLIPWEPFDGFGGMTTLRDAINRLMEESVVHPGRMAFVGRAFPLDMRETDHEYVIEAALPGFTPEQIQISATQDALTIRASTTSEQKSGPQGSNGQKDAAKSASTAEKPGVYVRRERYTGEIVRVISLPTPIDPNKVSATYEHGELTVTLPKAAHAQPKQIPIQLKETAGTR